MASRTLSFSSLASAFAPFPACSRPRHPPLRLLGLHLSSGHLLRASTLSTAAAPAPDADADADPYEGVDTVEHLLAPKPTSPVGVTSQEVVDVLEPYILEPRRDRIRRAVQSRSYAVCLVVEGLTDFGNVSAAFRSADALGVQSVHVISCEDNKRYRDNRHVSMGAEKWLDIELWSSPAECFDALKKRGYRIACTSLGSDSVSVYDMDWSHPTAIVVGNETMGISDVALKLSDMHCSVPMKGMVDSFNVSVAAGILMHHAVYDRVSRLQQQQQQKARATRDGLYADKE
uniref:tRNA guanosine-2'-O-methyltransferase n=1 Tax=Aegilops tauschii TaxID=37682 RepID=N1R216_AEGTA